MMLATKDEKLKVSQGHLVFPHGLGLQNQQCLGLIYDLDIHLLRQLLVQQLLAAFITMQKVLATSIGVGGVPGIFSHCSEWMGCIWDWNGNCYYRPICHYIFNCKTKKD